MGTIIYLTCMALASVIILVQPAVAQVASTTLPLTYPAQVLQSVDNQTCPSEEHREIARNEIKTAAQKTAPRFNSTWPAWIIGYERGTPSLFTGAGQSIDTFYIDGVSLTHGSPRQHIWSFGGGLDEVNSAYSCPCVTGSATGNRIPSFVGRNYFCEAGIPRYSSGVTFWPNGDPLWDGKGVWSH